MDQTISVGITDGQLSSDEALRFVGNDSSGAIAIFAGVTRRFTGDKETVRLEYDVYHGMAEAEMKRIARTLIGSTEARRVYLWHRQGLVRVGEVSVLIAVSAPHRNTSFEACRTAIDTLKRTVPIWKKEFFLDGSEEWVETAEIRSH